jgi:hypothetical protein
MNPIYLLLAAAILAGYAVALWRLLRSETAACLWTIAVLSAVALLLRLIEPRHYPGGLNGDEPLILYQAILAMQRGDLFGEGITGLPQLIPILFQAQLVPLVGAGRWAIRLYSIVGSVLSVAATFAVARAMRMRPISSLAAAAFVTFLPWSLLYGRISQGGELLFNQLLLLAALARLIWRDGDWREIPAGALGLCLLFYDYFSGRSMLAMPFIAAVLAPGRRRVLCLLIAVVGLVGFAPQAMRGHRFALVGLSMLQIHEGYAKEPLQTFATKTVNTLSSFAYPVATNGWMTVSRAAMHPWLILGLAALGLLTGWRRALFLAGGFVVGLMPSVVAHGDIFSSAHRIHAAYVFVALAAGAAFDLIPWRSLRLALAAAVVAGVAFWSTTFYFSDRFWNNEAKWMFGNDLTDLTESIPDNEPRVFEADLGYFLEMRRDLMPRVRPFAAEHLFLDGPALYVFGVEFAALRPFYEGLFPASAIQTFGRAFSVRVGHGDTTWLRRYGWAYRATCGDKVRQEQLPTLYHVGYSFSDFVCWQPSEHAWKGKWLGPPSSLRLWFGGNQASVSTGGKEIRPQPREPALTFNVEKDAEVTIRIVGSANPLASLLVITPQTERLPYWEWVEPVALP